MNSLARRFAENPILTPRDCRPSRADVVVECLLNPGVFRYQGKIGLLLRVAERPVQEEGWVSVPIVDPQAEGGVRVLRFDKRDPALNLLDPRVFYHAGVSYLTTLSHLRLAWSEDGVHFTIDPHPTLTGVTPLQSFGIEDARVSQLGDVYYLTYTSVSPAGVGIGLSSTRDWKTFTEHGMIFPPHNKDGAIFEEQVGGQYIALHRPSGKELGGNYIWIARSPDLLHWGDHRCIAFTRPGMWDAERVGAGCAPIRTPRGWLAIYHGADASHRYCLGLLLLDLHDPSRVIARSIAPIMEPTESYERAGFLGNVIFTNGHLVDGDRITLYYGASDSVICAATLSVAELLNSLAL